MKRNALINKILILAAAIFSVLFFGCGKDEVGKKAENIELNEVVPVSVLKVDFKAVGSKKTYGGTLEGIKQSRLIAIISERIVSINSKVGDYVKEGEIVFQLDKTGPASQFLQAQANLNNVERELNRMKALFKEGAVAQQQVDQVQTAYDVAIANYNAAKSAVDLISPISGKITAVNVNPGDWVMPGTELGVVADISQMIIKFNVSEMEVQGFELGMPVYIYSEFNTDQKQKGRIIEINRSASIEARSFQVKAVFSNTKDSFYKPGMFVKADVLLKWKDKVLAVPTQSIMHQGDGDYVYVIQNNISLPKKIKTGLGDENVTEIVSGINKGEIVVTAGMNNLNDGSRVIIVE